MALEIDLEGRRALVTGAGQGVGRAIASALGEAGATVYVNDVVASRVDEVVEDVRRRGGRSEGAPFDVTDWPQVHAVVDSTGGLDILVNNAGNAGTEGFAGLRPFAESEPSEWERYIRVNLYGVMNCTRAALPGMIGANGRAHRHDRVRCRSVRGRLSRSVRRREGRRGGILPLHRPRGGALRHHGELHRPGNGPHARDQH